MGQSSLPFTMGYPYLPFKDFHDNDHSVAGCISGIGRLLIFSAHKISKYFLLLLSPLPPPPRSPHNSFMPMRHEVPHFTEGFLTVGEQCYVLNC